MKKTLVMAALLAGLFSFHITANAAENTDLSSFTTGGDNANSGTASDKAGSVQVKGERRLPASLAMKFTPDTGEPTDAKVLMYVYAIAGPDPSQTNACEQFATNVVWRKYYYDVVDNELGWTVTTDLVSQPTDKTRTNLWFLVHAISSSASFTFTPDNLVFKGWSSDVGNALGKTEVFNTTNWIYTAKAMGVRWGSGGRGFNNTLITSGSYSNQLSHEMLMLVKSKHFNTPDATVYTNLDNALKGYYDFQVGGKWSLMSGTNDIAHGHKVLHMKLGSTPGILADKVITPGVQIEVGLTSNTNDSWVVEHRQSLEYGDWADTAILTGSESILRPANPAQTGFFRARKQ